jgi:hypothetical protein
MGYLDIKKNKKVVKNNKKDIDELINKYGFKPSLNQMEYLNYAYNNYETLINSAINFYEKEILEKGISINNSYFLQNASWLDEVIKDKDEYYKRLFIFEYLEKFK